MKTLGGVLEETNGIGQGFDSLRVMLSFAVLCWHAPSISYGTGAELAMWGTPIGVLGAALLPVFFALSGFLVMGRARSAPNPSACF